MKYARIFFGLLIILNFAAAKNMPEVIGFSDGQAAYIFLSRPVPMGNGVVLWKKVPGGKWQKALPVTVRPVQDPYRMQKMLGPDYESLAGTMKDADPTRLLTKLRTDPVYSLMLSFKMPRLAVILGRLLIDKTVPAGQSVRYRVSFVDANDKEVSHSKTIKVLIRKPVVREVKNLKVKVKNRLADIRFSYPKFDWNHPDWVVGFRVYRSEDGAKYTRVGKDFIFRLDTPKVELQDGLLTYGKTYWYKVTTLSYFGYESHGSTPVKVYAKDLEAPLMVKNVRAGFNDNGILVSWDMSSEQDVVGYDVLRGTNPDRVNKHLNKSIIPALQTFFLDSTGVEGEKYFYGIIAIDQAGNRSHISARPYAVWPDSTPPAPPKIVKAKYWHGRIHISWTPVKGEKLRGYFVYRGQDKKNLNQLTQKPVGQKRTVYADSGNGLKKFKYGEQYWIAVRAVDMSWNLSDFSYTQIIIPDTIPPRPSTGAIVEVRQNGDVHVNWNPSPSADVVRYLVILNEAGKKKPVLQQSFATDTLRTIFHRLPKGKTFMLNIISVDRAGNKSTKALQKKIVVRDYVPPPHPRNVFLEQTKTGYKFSWNKVVDFDLAGYLIYRSKSPMGTYEAVIKKPVNTVQYVLPLNAKDGYYQVRAVDTSGNESKGNEVVQIFRAKGNEKK